MKRVYAFLICMLCLLLPLFSLAEGAQNLLPNGGFEQLDSAGDPDGWYITAYRTQQGYSRLFVTSERAHSGIRSAVIENASANDARYTCTVRVEPETLYRLSGYVFVERMEEEGNGANLAIEGLYAFSDCFYQTSGGWEYVEWYGETGENQTELTLGVRIGGYGAESVGKAYFDDIQLEKVDALPIGVSASIWYNMQPPAAAKPETDAVPAKSTLLFVLLGFAFLLLYLLSKPLLRQKKERYASLAFGALMLLALIARVLLARSVPGYQVDINCFSAWSLRMAENGPAGFYSPDYFCDYPPGYMLLLWPCGFLLKAVGYGTPAGLLVVKLVPIVCDMLGAIALYAYAVKRIGRTPAAFVACLYALNPAVLVNGAAWGQVDSLLALLMLCTAIQAMERKWQFALPLFVVSALMKPQALLFAPIGGIWLILCLVRERESMAAQLKRIAIGLGFSVLCALCIVVPFSIGQEKPVGWLVELYGKTLSSYAHATLNTANLYYLAGANWADLNAVAPWLLPALTALASCAFGIGLLWREKKQTNTLSLRKKRTLLALCSFALAVAQALVWIFAGNYAAYGYAMMVYCFAYAIVCMCVDPKPEGLPFYMALALIGIYLLGVKVHERYLFPALALLLLSYITTKDRRALHLCVGFSITTFLNTAIVLDNSILFGAAQGHLNPDTLALNVVLCVVNLLLCGYAGYIALSGLRETVEAPTPEVAEEETQTTPPAYKQMLLEPMDARLHLTLRDWLVMGVTTVLYGVLAFSNLGSTVAPQDGWISTSPDEQIIFELPQSQSFKVLYYAGVSYNGFSIAVSEDGQSWSNDFYCEMREGLCYRWNYACQSEIVEEQPDFAKKLPDDVRRFHDQYVRLNTSTDGVLWLKGKYLRLNADEAGLNLFEIALRDANDELIPLTVVKHTGANESLLADAKPAQNLLNEQNTCVGEPGWFTGTYFDEIYHARTAYEHLHGQAPYETTHPPLGKLMMSVGIALFGMTPFGWRFAGAFIGVWMLPALYLLALQLTKRRSLATVAMLALTFDLMHYTQTRIATIDSFPVLFIILSYLLMARYMQTDVFAVGAGEKPRLFTKAYWRSLIPLALCGLCMGLSIASKWIGLYSAVGLAVLFFIAVYRQYRVGNIAYAYSAEDADEEPNENRRARIFGAQEFALKRVFMTCGFCVLFFILVPCVIYYLSYIPYLSPTGPVTLQRIIAAQQGMLSYHSTPGLGMDHPFQSPWWQWPFILKPMWFSQDKFEPDGYAATIMCMGNPWVFYIGAICMVAIILAFVLKYVKLRDGVRLRRGDGDLTLCVVIIGFMAQYLPWVLVPRSMYMYHYFASVPFIILATVWMIGKIPDSRRAWRRGVIALYVAGAIAFFVMFFPYASGWLTSTSWLDAMKWFSKLYY